MWTASLPSLPSGAMDKVAMTTEKAVHSLENMGFCSPRLTWIQLLLDAASANSRDQHSTRYGIIPQGDHAAAWWRVGDLGPLSLWKGQCFVLIGADSYSGYGSAFPTCNALPKAPLVDLQNTLSTTMVFYTALPLTNKLNSYPPKCDSVPKITILPTILKPLAR